jgi:SAM-dependent methyltransferase
VAPISARRAHADLFLVSFLILFFELAAIRWFGATVVFLTFFTNVVLLACFLGMSIGLLAAGRAQRLVRSTLPLAVVAVGLALVTLIVYERWEALTVTVGAAEASPRLIYFGTEYRPADATQWVVPIWAIGGVFFALIALTFVGLGQVMGRAFEAIPDRVAAYSTDVLGSLTGIATFGLASWLELSPLAWFVPIVALILYFARPLTLVQGSAAVALIALAGIGAHGLIVHGELRWSPYYKIHYLAGQGGIYTNNIGHQAMVRVGTSGPAYLLPHLLNREAGQAPFADVVVVGAGSGNDVAAALQSGAKRVDAVEIDPVIAAIGRADHPDQPYADPRVTLHNDDGRSHLRNAPRRYDLAVYALVDSLVLHSGYSSLRLENFLFTREAFEDAREALAPEGVFVLYNYYRQGWVVGRIAALAEDVFGAKPVVVSLPYREAIGAQDGGDGFTVIIAGAPSKRLEAIRALLAGAAEVRLGERRIGASRVDIAQVGRLPSDDWPQLYLRSREIPWSPIGQGMLVMAILSILILAAFAPRGRPRIDGRMFFLGAGFMLLETKGVVHMALLFGSTWVVNSIVFAAILVMVLLANLYVHRWRPTNLAPYYALLIAGLLLNAFVPMSTFLSLAPLPRALASCAVVFVPVFFAGVVFSAAFSRSTRPGSDFGSNVAGIILGGLSEQLSLLAGFNALILVAIAYYLLSILLRPRTAS